MAQIDIKKLSVVELKALAYDFRNAIEAQQHNLQVITKELQERASMPPLTTLEDAAAPADKVES